MPYEYVANGKKVVLTVDEDSVAIRFSEPAPKSLRASVVERGPVGPYADRIEVPGEKFTVVGVAQTKAPRGVRHLSAMESIGKQPEVARVAPVFKVGPNKALATDRLLVGFKPGSNNAEEILKHHGCVVLEKSGETKPRFLVKLNESVDPFNVIEDLMAVSEVAYAEPDFVTLGRHMVHPTKSPRPASGDPLSERQYATKITQAVEAWKLQEGDPSVVIAILDEGVDTRHEDLSGCIVGSYDATDNDEFQEPNRWDGHGTCCAGLAAASHDNEKGIKGIGGGCSMLAVRIAYSPFDGGNWVTTNNWIARAITWSWKSGAWVLSNSWGGGLPSSAISDAFEEARTEGRNGKGCVVVVAAGNEDGPVTYPADLPDVLSVSASNEFDEPKTKVSQDGETWWGSCFGPEVDVAAPGVHNYTTDITETAGYDPSNYFATFNGTSSATPIVAGAAALVLSANKALTEADVRKIICDTADKVGSIRYVEGRNDRMGSGRLNVLKAVTKAKGAV